MFLLEDVLAYVLNRDDVIISVRSTVCVNTCTLSFELVLILLAKKMFCCIAAQEINQFERTPELCRNLAFCLRVGESFAYCRYRQVFSINPVPLRLVMIQPRMNRAEFRVLESELRDYLISVPEHSLSE